MPRLKVYEAEVAVPPGIVRSLMNTPSCTGLFSTSHGEYA